MLTGIGRTSESLALLQESRLSLEDLMLTDSSRLELRLDLASVGNNSPSG
jgi:hypothetical protein